MKNLLPVLITACMALMGVSGQNYTPAKGETVLELAVEGRGNIYIKLHTKEAPKTTKHIIELVKKGFYDGQRFFQVEKIPKPFYVKFGDPNTRTKDLDDPSIGTGGSGERIAYENSGFKHKLGSVGLATPPNDRDGGDSQFFINLGENRFLDGSYTVFGLVMPGGMDVVNKVQKGDRVTKATILVGPQ